MVYGRNPGAETGVIITPLPSTRLSKWQLSLRGGLFKRYSKDEHFCANLYKFLQVRCAQFIQKILTHFIELPGNLL